MAQTDKHNNSTQTDRQKERKLADRQTNIRGADRQIDTQKKLDVKINAKQQIGAYLQNDKQK